MRMLPSSRLIQHAALYVTYVKRLHRLDWDLEKNAFYANTISSFMKKDVKDCTWRTMKRIYEECVRHGVEFVEDQGFKFEGRFIMIDDNTPHPRPAGYKWSISEWEFPYEAPHRIPLKGAKQNARDANIPGVERNNDERHHHITR